MAYKVRMLGYIDAEDIFKATAAIEKAMTASKIETVGISLVDENEEGEIDAS